MGRFSIKMQSYYYMDSHDKDKTAFILKQGVYVYSNDSL